MYANQLVYNFMTDSKYALIHFNHGLHGIHLSKKSYKSRMNKLLSKIDKDVKLILASSTIVYREGNKRLDGAWMKRVRERNAAVQEIAEEKGCTIDDLYTVSLNANPENNVAEIVRKHCDRIAFAHIRNVKHFENGDFSEASHRDCDGDTGILDILKAYHDCGFKGYVRPDHGRHLWGEKAGTVRPGYGLYDRALGIMYMLGVWDMLEKLDGKN